MVLKAHLETNTLQLEGRRKPRRALQLETSGALPDGAEANVTVHNISAAGLLIASDLALSVGEVLSIELPDVGPVGAEIVWESENLFGCAFQQALGEAALAAAQLRGGVSALGAFVDGIVKPVPDSAPFASHEDVSTSRGQARNEGLGHRLNRLRRERGLTLAQVGEALGVSKPTVWAWEKGKARPIPERIEAIAKVLGVRARDLSDTQGDRESAAVTEECRERIATAYGADPKNVRIMIEV